MGDCTSKYNIGLESDFCDNCNRRTGNWIVFETASLNDRNYRSFTIEIVKCIRCSSIKYSGQIN
jgi:hypothetical protein